MNEFSLSLPTDETDTAQIQRTVLSIGGFSLTKCSSNSCVFFERFELGIASCRCRPRQSIDSTTRPCNAMGPWTRCLPLDSHRNDKNKQTPTQRSFLKFTSLQFDPLGLTAPQTIRLRFRMKLAWTTGQQWASRRTPSWFPSMDQQI